MQKQMSVWHTSYRVNHPVQGELWLEGSASPTQETDGRITWYGFIRDITEIQQARESQRLASKVLASTSDAVIILDNQGRVESVNPAFEHLTGFSLENLAEKNLNILSPTGYM